MECSREPVEECELFESDADEMLAKDDEIRSDIEFLRRGLRDHITCIKNERGLRKRAGLAHAREKALLLTQNRALREQLAVYEKLSGTRIITTFQREISFPAPGSDSRSIAPRQN